LRHFGGHETAANRSIVHESVVGEPVRKFADRAAELATARHEDVGIVQIQIQNHESAFLED